MTFPASPVNKIDGVCYGERQSMTVTRAPAGLPTPAEIYGPVAHVTRRPEAAAVGGVVLSGDGRVARGNVCTSTAAYSGVQRSHESELLQRFYISDSQA